MYTAPSSVNATNQLHSGVLDTQPAEVEMQYLGRNSVTLPVPRCQDIESDGRRMQSQARKVAKQILLKGTHAVVGLGMTGAGGYLIDLGVKTMHAAGDKLSHAVTESQSHANVNQAGRGEVAGGSILVMAGLATLIAMSSAGRSCLMFCCEAFGDSGGDC